MENASSCGLPGYSGRRYPFSASVKSFQSRFTRTSGSGPPGEENRTFLGHPRPAHLHLLLRRYRREHVFLTVQVPASLGGDTRYCERPCVVYRLKYRGIASPGPILAVDYIGDRGAVPALFLAIEEPKFASTRSGRAPRRRRRAIPVVVRDHVPRWGSGGSSSRVGLISTNRAAPRQASHPSQQPDEPLVVLRTPGLLRQLAYGEVRLLLTGAWSAEGQAPDVHRRRRKAGTIRLAAHLAGSQLCRCLGREVFLCSANTHSCPFPPLRVSYPPDIFAGRPWVRIVRKGDPGRPKG